MNTCKNINNYMAKMELETNFLYLKMSRFSFCSVSYRFCSIYFSLEAFINQLTQVCDLFDKSLRSAKVVLTPGDFQGTVYHTGNKQFGPSRLSDNNKRK